MIVTILNCWFVLNGAYGFHEFPLTWKDHQALAAQVGVKWDSKLFEKRACRELLALKGVM